jgi:hypothetical protein
MYVAYLKAAVREVQAEEQRCLKTSLEFMLKILGYQKMIMLFV